MRTQAIIAAGLYTLDYFVQGMTSAIANHGETLAPLMHRAGFRYPGRTELRLQLPAHVVGSGAHARDVVADRD